MKKQRIFVHCIILTFHIRQTSRLNTRQSGLKRFSKVTKAIIVINDNQLITSNIHHFQANTDPKMKSFIFAHSFSVFQLFYISSLFLI